MEILGIVLITHIVIGFFAYKYLQFSSIDEANATKMQPELDKKSEILESEFGIKRQIIGREVVKQTKEFKVFLLFIGIACIDILLGLFLNFPLESKSIFFVAAGVFIFSGIVIIAKNKSLAISVLLGICTLIILIDKMVTKIILSHEYGSLMILGIMIAAGLIVMHFINMKARR